MYLSFSVWLISLSIMPLGSIFIVVQSLSCVRLFATPWTAACQASLSFTVSQSLLKLMSIESLMLSNHLILLPSSLFCLQSFPDLSQNQGLFPISWLFTSGGQSIGASASVSILPINIQGWFPLGLTDLISLQSKSGIICISKVVVISPGNLDSSLWFIQPSISYDVLCI